MPLALRLALRELRGGLRGFGIFLLCIVLGVAAIAAVGGVRGAVLEGIGEHGRPLLGGDIELLLGKRAIIGAFPWRYEGLESCPCRIVAFLDAGENIEAVGDAAKAILGA